MSEKIYPAGAKHCDVCGDPLPPIFCARARKHFLCKKPACAISRAYPLHWIRGRHCSNPSCAKTVPATLYSGNPRLIFCSNRCRANYEFSLRVSVRVECSICKKELRRRPENASGPQYCLQHNKVNFCEQRDRAECGRFYRFFQSYLRDFCIGHYRSLYAVRCEIRQFLKFLSEKGIKSLNDVTPDLIREFLSRSGEHNSRAYFVKKMFAYLIEKGEFRKPNPVMTRVHYKPREPRKARPYTEKEMTHIDEIVDSRGTLQVKVIMALGKDFGPRRIELCNLYDEDVDTAHLKVWIRNPTKNGIAGHVPISRHTAKLVNALRKQRPRDCKHDFFLSNSRGGPLRPHNFNYLMNSVLLKNWLGDRRSEGLDRFNFHRIRHRNATLLSDRGMRPSGNRKIHRWSHDGVMYQYIAPSQGDVLAEYRRVMGTVVANSDSSRRTRVIQGKAA